jgi:hypothetical protein
MDKETKTKLAALLRGAAKQTIPEADFWAGFKSFIDPLADPVVGLAYESAIHYWGNFHERNLLLIRVKPDQYQLQHDQNELNLIVEALERDWPIEELKRRLNDI